MRNPPNGPVRYFVNEFLRAFIGYGKLFLIAISTSVALFFAYASAKTNRVPPYVVASLLAIAIFGFLAVALYQHSSIIERSLERASALIKKAEYLIFGLSFLFFLIYELVKLGVYLVLELK